MNLDEIRLHMRERDFAANGLFPRQQSGERPDDVQRRILLQLADDVPGLVAEVDRLNLQIDEMRDGDTYDQQVRDDFAREFFGDQEGKLWAPGLTLKKLLEMVREKYIEKRVDPAPKCTHPKKEEVWRCRDCQELL